MKAILLLIFGAAACIAQTHSVELCDQEISPKCVKLTVPATLAANSTISLPTVMVTTGGQTITGSDTWSAVQTYTANILASGAGVNVGAFANPFAAMYSSLFEGTNLVLTDGTNAYNFGVNTGTHNLELSLLSANIARFTGGATPDVYIYHSMTLAALTSQPCLGTDSSGNVEAGTCGATGVTSIATTGPISGGTITTTGTISCPTCMVTGGGQTVTGSDTWNAVQTYTANILASGAGVDVGAFSNPFAAMYSSLFEGTNIVLEDGTTFYNLGDNTSDHKLYLSASTVDIVRWVGGATPTEEVMGSLLVDGSATLSTSLAGTFNMSGNQTVTGNWYNRTFSGTPSCSGVPDGWQGFDTSNEFLWICQGGNAYRSPAQHTGTPSISGSSCGIVSGSTDSRGYITASSVSGTCSLTFATAFASPPFCLISASGAFAQYNTGTPPTTTGFTIFNSSSPILVEYACIQ